MKSQSDFALITIVKNVIIVSIEMMQQDTDKHVLTLHVDISQ